MSLEKLQSLTEQYQALTRQQQELEKDTQHLLELVDTPPSSKIKMAVYGLLNSGKSTLLNILTNHINEDYFQTGDRRVTVSTQVLETEDLIYIDTPGIDGGSQDDLVASIGKDKADLILFVHNAAKELEQEEIDLLLELKAAFGKNTKDSVILLMSRADSLDATDLEKVKAKITEQCQELLQEQLDILCISSHMFRKSVNEESEKRKQGFLKLSHIDTLQNMIQDRLGRLDPVGSFVERLTAKIEQQMAKNSELQEQMFLLSKQIKSEFNDSFDNFNNQMDSFKGWLGNTRDAYTSKHNEMQRLKRAG